MEPCEPTPGGEGAAAGVSASGQQAVRPTVAPTHWVWRCERSTPLSGPFRRRTCSQRHRRTVEAAFGEEGSQRGGGGVERGVLLAVRLHRRGRNATRVPKKNLEIEHSRTLHPTPRATCLLLLNSTHDAPGLVQVALLRPDGRLVTARPKVRLVVACVIIGKHKTKVSRTASAHLPPGLLYLR